MNILGKDGRVTAENFGCFQYIPAAIKETMRLKPAVDAFTSRVTLEDMVIEDVFVPKGTTIFFSLIPAHYRSDYWKDPLSFKPQRFIEQPQDWNRVFSFSKGPRICLGHKFASLEMIVIISRLLQKYHIQLKPGWEWKYNPRAILVSAVGGIPLLLTQRK